MIQDIDERFSKLEEKLLKEVKQFKDADSDKELVKDIMVKVNKRIDKIEKATSIVDIKTALKTFEDRLEIIKKRISYVSNRIEDLEIQTTIMKKMYRTTKESLEPSQVLTKEEDADSISPDLMKKERITEKRASVTVEKMPETTEERKKSIELKRFRKPVNMGNGLSVTSVEFKKYGASSILKGELRNDPREDINSASFVLRIFSENESLIAEVDFNITNIKSGASNTFDELLSGILPSQISRYEIKHKKSL